MHYCLYKKKKKFLASGVSLSNYVIVDLPFMLLWGICTSRKCAVKFYQV